MEKQRESPNFEHPPDACLIFQSESVTEGVRTLILSKGDTNPEKFFIKAENKKTFKKGTMIIEILHFHGLILHDHYN